MQRTAGELNWNDIGKRITIELWPDEPAVTGELTEIRHQETRIVLNVLVPPVPSSWSAYGELLDYQLGPEAVVELTDK